MASSYVHERDHYLKTYNSFTHFETEKKVYNSKYYTFTSEAYKSHVQSLFKGYLAAQNTFLLNEIKKFSNNNSLFSKDQINNYVNKYNSNLTWYSTRYKENSFLNKLEPVK